MNRCPIIRTPEFKCNWMLLRTGRVYTLRVFLLPLQTWTAMLGKTRVRVAMVRSTRDSISHKKNVEAGHIRCKGNARTELESQKHSGVTGQTEIHSATGGVPSADRTEDGNTREPSGRVPSSPQCKHVLKMRISQHPAPLRCYRTVTGMCFHQRVQRCGREIWTRGCLKRRVSSRLRGLQG